MPLSQIVSASIEDGAVAPVDLSSVAQYTGFKNRLINGAMVIDQRNNGASVTQTVANLFSVDRWGITGSVTSKFTAQRNAGSVTPPVGFTNYLGITSSSAYSVLTADFFVLQQLIEGYNIADLGFGTASASSVTLSFLVRSSLTGTFSGSICNSIATRNYIFNYTISSANTWTAISVTIPGDTTGTWATDNTTGLSIRFGLGCGSTFSGTAGSWGSSNLVQSTGSVSIVGTNGATFYVTGVQLEKGVTATSFDYRPFGTELQLCQRYFEKSNTTETVVPTNTAGGYTFFSSAAIANGAQWGWQIYKVTKRTFATINVYSYTSSTASTVSNASGTDLAAASGTSISQNQVGFWLSNNSGGTITPAVGGFIFQWRADSEL
jgi:hypothetical protein